MSTTLSCLILSLIICGAIVGGGSVLKTTESLEHDRDSFHMSLCNVDSNTELLFMARYTAAHETSLAERRTLAQPYDICQACIMHCGGAATPAEQCMAPCSRACGLDVPDALTAARQHNER